MEYVNVSPSSTSVVLSVPTSVPCAAFSATVVALRLMPVGASFTSVSVTVNALSNVKPPLSVLRTVTDTVGVASKSNTPVPTSTLSPLIWNAADTPCAVMEYVNVSPSSTSVVLSVPTSVPCAAFSATVVALRLMSEGGVPNCPVAVDPRFPTPSSPTQNTLLPATSETVTDTVKDPAELTAVD